MVRARTSWKARFPAKHGSSSPSSKNLGRRGIHVAITEQASIRLRGDLFNATNRAQYGAPNADVWASNFSIITTTVSPYATGRGTPRELQLSLKIAF